MKKLKIYLDTSVISHLDQQDAPQKTEDTLKFWEILKGDKYEVFISIVDMLELERCQEEKFLLLKNKLDEVSFIFLDKNDEAEELAELYVASNILTQKNINDCRHIAYACVANCDMVVSWNFKHIVNYKTIRGVKSVNAIAGYKEMEIYTPTMLLSEEEI